MVMKKWKKPQFLTEAFFNGFRSGPLFACLSSRVRFGLMVNGLNFFLHQMYWALQDQTIPLLWYFLLISLTFPAKTCKNYLP